MKPTRLLIATALLLTAAFALAACGTKKKSASASATTASAASCSKSSLALYKPGRLTVATDKPAYPPYFDNNDPADGKGFESAVAYAIAGRLGFSRAQVKWTTEPFNSSYAPGPKHFDFDVNEISITPPRAKVVDFSAPYYTAPQAVVVPKGSKLAGVTTLAGLANAEIGVQIGTTSLDAVTASIKPKKSPKVLNDSNDVVTALKEKLVDAIVTDAPTAFYITSAQVPGSKVIGQFQAPGGDTWGALLARGSALTPCVSRAVASLRSSGQLQKITAKWMGAGAGVADLK
jgi:polar amino acid transport system substrate-binding protein